MIRQDKGETTLDGSPDMILSELPLLINTIQKKLNEETGISLEQFDSDLAASLGMYRLTDSGMDVEEALYVTGIRDKVHSITEVDIDGTGRSVDLGN